MTALLETRDLVVRFGGVVAVDHVSLRIEPGELRCLIGPNGAGKSTFFKCLTGQLAPGAGSVLWRGRDITGLPPFAVARLGVGIKTQVPSLFDGLSVLQGVALAARRVCTEAESRRRAAAVLDQLGIAALAAREAGSLAHGERQMAELAMVIAPAPALILLDEPTAGMTGQETRRIAELIRGLNRNHTIVVVEHDMAFVRAIAGRVTVLHQGRVLRDGDAQDVFADPLVRDVYLGRAA